MRLRLLLPTFALMISAAACSREEAAPAATPAPQAAADAAAPAAPPPAPAGAQLEITDWDPAALKLAEELAAKLRAAGTPCDEYEVIPYGMYAGDYIERLKMAQEDLPLAETFCTSTDDEDITFSIFADRQLAERFVERKRRLLCRRAKKLTVIAFPGFPYVLGDRWVIQPDDRVTATAIGDILGATALMASCDEEKIKEEAVEVPPAAEAK
jgi:hypothetical protein